jgi:hypothetical protein
MFIAACAAPHSTEPAQPTPLVAAQQYHVSTSVTLSVELILPAQLEGIVTTLRTFSHSPGQAILELPAEAGVPAASTILALLPDSLKQSIEGFIDSYIAPIEVNCHKLTTIAGDIANLAETSLGTIQIDSTLVLSPGAADHQLDQLDVLDAQIPLDIAGDLVAASTTAAIDQDTLTLGDQTFGFELGEYAWRALNDESTQLFGADIRTLLGNAVDCPAFGAAIANECILGLCVGHADLLTDACNSGLDFVVDTVHAELTSIDLDAVELASGTATLVDDDGDGTADRLVNGTWDASLNAGQGLRHVPATFAGSR